MNTFSRQLSPFALVALWVTLALAATAQPPAAAPDPATPPKAPAATASPETAPPAATETVAPVPAPAPAPAADPERSPEADQTLRRIDQPERPVPETRGPPVYFDNAMSCSIRLTNCSFR